MLNPERWIARKFEEKGFKRNFHAGMAHNNGAAASKSGRKQKEHPRLEALDVCAGLILPRSQNQHGH
jgi:hypothetical protein